MRHVKGRMLIQGYIQDTVLASVRVMREGCEILLRWNDSNTCGSIRIPEADANEIITHLCDSSNGTIQTSKNPTIRVRVSNSSDKGVLTIKAPGNGISRPEFEYDINTAWAMELMKLATDRIEKVRYVFPVFPETLGLKWELDVFHGDNTGLIIAEVELPSEDFEFPKPEWLGEEVTYDFKYTNLSLSKYPYGAWEQNSMTKSADSENTSPAKDN
jgi:adenylate cyclase